MNRTRIVTAVWLLACACALAACRGASPSPAARTAASIMRALPNAEYPIDFVRTGRARLRDGVFEEEVAPGSATKTRVMLGNQQAAGDLNGDGVPDAAVTLIANPGGSGTFTYLAAVIDQNGTANPMASVLLGDRIIVESIAIESGEILVTLLTRRPDEPMAALPTVERKRKFKLRGDDIIEVQ